MKMEKYLGDYIHQGGVKESVASTIRNRKGRIMNAILEARSTIEDVRINTIGGATSGLDLWEIYILHVLLACSINSWLSLA